MTDGDDETDLPAETLDARLDAAAEALADAETEADLDAVGERLDGIAADLDTADLPAPDGDDADDADPEAELDSRLSSLRDDVTAARGPYASDVTDAVEDAAETVADTRWTDTGERAVVAAVETFVAGVNEALGTALTTDVAAVAEAPDAFDAVGAAVADAGLDPDDDADTIRTLLDTTDALAAGLDDAEEWDDLETHEKLQAQGYYDALGHYKDFPPEWAALKEWEQRGNVEMVLLALDSFQSEFMERHCLDALTRMNDEAAFDAMHQRAGKRDKPSIRAIGKMGADDAVETLLEYVDADSDPGLQKVTFKALGEIGSEAATGPLANKLDAENEQIRPYAARALGLIGDTRAIDPLADALAAADTDETRAAAAWALRQIGTERALAAAAAYADDRAYLVQHEASRAADALSAEPTA
jgi:hypothetical protein